MKVKIAALNSQYIHMSLAPWYLKAQAARDNNTTIIEIAELTVNMEFRRILSGIADGSPDVIAFSCYIFNIETVEKLTGDLKKILPDTKIILGGPEVSFDPAEQLARMPGADYVISGEGEIPFSRLLACIGQSEIPSGIAGVTYRAADGTAIRNACSAPPSLNSLASPYTDEMLRAAGDRIFYYESSRGCPFRCSYCLSSESGGARFFPLDRVKSELSLLLSSGLKQIKFVDRTFNCGRKRAKEIFRFVIEKALTDGSGQTARKNLHFEAAADLFDDEMISILSRSPKGFIQLEIGIQSLNGDTLSSVRRKTDLPLCMQNIRRLLAPGNIHIHLDLIAGLPGEDLPSFEHSFNGVYALHPHTIQLGFLKLLKGSDLRREADGGSCRYSSHPPYEVLSTPCLSYAELRLLQNIAQIVERLSNSGKFRGSVHYMVERFDSPFVFFRAFSDFLEHRGFYEKSVSLKELYSLFDSFSERFLSGDELAVFHERIKFDYFSTDNSCNPPACIKRIENPGLKELYRTLRRENPGLPFHLETFAFDPLSDTGGPVVLLFDYSRKDRVTGTFETRKV